MRKFIFNVFLPAGLFLACFIYLFFLPGWSRPPVASGGVPGSLIKAGPVFLLLGALLLATYFNSLRLFLVDLLLLFTYFVLHGRPVLELLPAGALLSRFLAYNLPTLYFAVPLLIVAIHFSRESGVFTNSGFIQVVALSLFIFGLWPALMFFIRDQFLFTAREILTWSFPVYGGHLAFPLLSIGLLLVAFVAFSLNLERSFYVHNQFLMFWVTVSVFLALWPGVSATGNEPVAAGFQPVLLFGVAVLLLLIKVINFAWDKAYLDPLTQVRGRMALDEKLVGLTGQYAIAMIDIDNFKDFNDKFGHDAGDKVLRQVADILEFNSTGLVYRFGGEEFTIVYPGETVESTKEELEWLRKKIANNKVGVTRKTKQATKVLQKKVTVSMGLSAVSDKFPAPGEVLNAADNALFSAKDSGRNCLKVKD